MTDVRADEPMDDGQVSEDELATVPGRGRLALGAALVTALLVAGLVWVLLRNDPSTDRSAYTHLRGQPAPEVTGGSLLDGASFDIDDHLGSWVVVNFFATWCPPCIDEHPELDAFDAAYRQSGEAVLVSVVFDDSPDDVAAFFERYGGDWPVIDDPTGSIQVDFGVAQVPETFLVDPNGVVRDKLIGGVTRAGIEQRITELVLEDTGEGEAS